MTLGTGDRKKVGLLAVFGLFALYMVYSNLLSGPGPAPAPAAAGVPAASTAAPAETAPAPQPEVRRATYQVGRSQGRSGEFYPVLRSKRPEDRIDPMSVDPTLRLDLLAKVQDQQPAGGTRNLFQFSTPPPKPAELPKGPEPKVLPKPPGVGLQTASAGVKAAEPPPPPPPYKYYGYTTERDSGRKKAFFLNGDDIFVATEGQVLNNRFRLVRIGPTSAVFEDTHSKRQSPVPLVEEAGG